MSQLARPGIGATGPSSAQWDETLKLESDQLIAQTTADHLAVWADNSKAVMQQAKQYPPNNTYTGRSVMVGRGELGRAFADLDKILSKNKVRQYLRETARYEKPGEKRRRLSSERWRTIFANEVRKNVQLATKIRYRAG